MAASEHSTPPGHILVLSKAMRILEAFRDECETATPTQMAAIVGFTRGTTHRLMSSLRHVGLLDHDATRGSYRLSTVFLRFGEAVTDRLDLISVAREPLHHLHDELGHTVFLATRDDWRAVCIRRLPGKGVDVLTWRLGTGLPLHAGAAPRVLLAGMPQESLSHYLSQPLKPLTPKTLCSRPQLERNVRQTRKRGYVVAHEDVTLGVSAIGVPILGPDDHTVAALSISGLSIDYKPNSSEISSMIAAVKSAAQQVSDGLQAA